MKANWEDFVEARIVGIEVRHDRQTAKIVTEGLNCRYSSINLQGVERILVNEFRETNVIESATLWAANLSPLTEKLAFLISNSDDLSRQADFKEAIEEVKSKIEAGTLVFFEIEPIYGAWIMALVRDVACLDRT